MHILHVDKIMPNAMHRCTSKRAVYIMACRMCWVWKRFPRCSAAAAGKAAWHL